MTKPAHTPGPWTFISLDEIDEVSGPFTICDTELNDLANFYSADESTVTTTREQAIANVMLAAAAPDLLAMLLAIKKHGELANVGTGGWLGNKPAGNPMSKDLWQFPRHMLPELDAAIAKATGEA